MARSVCRQIQLYKLPITSMETERISFQYMVYGHYDGFLTKKLDSQFSALWQASMNDNNANFCDYQNFFLFHEDERKDFTFWKNAELYNFVFVTFVHLETGNIDEVRSFLQQQNDNMICYRTLDNSDIIFASYSNEFATSLQALMDIYVRKNNELKYKLNYIYSFFASPIDLINQDQIESNEILKNVMIRYMVRDFNEVYRFNEALKEATNTHEEVKIMLGHDDCIIILPQIDLKKLLHMYAKHEIMSIDNELRKRAVFSTDTRFTADYIFDKIIADPIPLPTNSSWSFHQIDQIKMLKQKLYKESDQLILNILTEIIKGMAKLENSGLYDYTFLSLFYPLDMIMNKLKEKDTLHDDETNEILQFLDGATEVLARSNYSSIQLFQIPVHPNKVYNAPGKLLAFYAAYLDKLILYAIDEPFNKKRYSFLVSPFFTNMTGVQIIFNREVPENRLLLVKVPAYDLYNPRKLCFILTHELFHFVGEKERCRANRLNILIKLCISLISSYLVTNEVRVKFEAYNMNSFDEQLYNKLIERFQSDLIIYKQDKYYLYAGQIYKFLLKTCSTFLNDYIVSEAFMKDFLRVNNIEGFCFDSVFIEIKTEFKDAILQNYYDMIDASKKTNINHVISAYIDLTRECYADLYAIMLLQVTYKEYMQFLDVANHKQLSESFMLITRISLIANELIASGFWKEEDLNPPDSSADIYTNINEIYINLHAKNDKFGDDFTSYPNLFNKQECFYFMSEYLNDCLEAKKDKMSVSTDMVKNIKKIFDICKDKTDLMEFSKILDDLIQEFRLRVHEDKRM